MKRILVFLYVLIMGGFILNASPRVSMANAATYDVTGVWRLYWDDDFEGSYYFYGSYLKFIGTSTSGTYEWYSNFKGDSNPAFTYSVDGTSIYFNDYGNDYFSGTFENKNTIEGLYAYGYANYDNVSESVSYFKLERVVSDDQPPFGSFEIPANGASVSGSIPISGWALDDTMITSLKIYYSDASAAAAKDPDNWYLIEDDVKFLFGARPDVAYQYSDNYYSDWAGWGYMCLTYFLPNGGIGPFMLHVVATDIAGNSITWSVTLNGDNAHRVKPFGAIDTPEQGGRATVYASENYKYRNWGWALTPMPNSIPTNYIDVFVDGVKLGNVTYNLYRADIANFFPGYANSYGAGGYFDIDLSSYDDDSQHTLYWFAIDSAGNRDGIGSRFFYVDKRDDTWSTSSSKSRANFASVIKKKRSRERKTLARNQFTGIPVNRAEPISIKIGFNKDAEYRWVFPDETGINRVEIGSRERIEIKVSENKDWEITGYSVLINDRVGPLPIGSTLDKKNKTFYWIPGPGFIGTYECLFVEKGKNGETGKRKIVIVVKPKL